MKKKEIMVKCKKCGNEFDILESKFPAEMLDVRLEEKFKEDGMGLFATFNVKAKDGVFPILCPKCGKDTGQTIGVGSGKSK